MAKPKFAPNPKPRIDGQEIGKGYTYIPGETVNIERPNKKNNPIDDDKNWKRLPNTGRGRRF